jgi:hypothetical protein
MESNGHSVSLGASTIVYPYFEKVSRHGRITGAALKLISISTQVFSVIKLRPENTRHPIRYPMYQNLVVGARPPRRRRQ